MCFLKSAKLQAAHQLQHPPLRSNKVRWSSLILLALLPLKAFACGLDWSEPVSHFENVDFQGKVHIVRKLGEVEKLPIYLIFNSSYGTSPYVGSGFEIPLLESRIWQVDENRFQMKSPSGWLWIFQRTKYPNVLEGNAGWKGLIKDDSITVWAPCGDKISFRNGRIVSMQLKADKIDYVYKNNRVESIQMNGRPILEVKSDDKTGDATGISLPNTRELIGLQLTGNRPKVEVIDGRSVVGRMERCLGKATRTDGSSETFEFGVDEKVRPTINLGGNRLIVWNQLSKLILKDQESRYESTPGEGTFSNAAIRRINEKNQSDSWNCDGAKGLEIIESLDGTRTETKRFTSGKLAGAIRRRDIVRNGISHNEYLAIYSENGQLSREDIEGIKYSYEYDERSKLKNLFKDGKLYKTIEYNKGQVAKECYADGLVRTYQQKGETIMITNRLPTGTIYYEIRMAAN